jgi:methyl-accepting chemotaxis protein
MKLNLFAKLIGGFAVVLALMGAVGWTGLNGVSDVNGHLDAMYEDRLVPITDLGEAVENLYKIRLAVIDHLLTTDRIKMTELEGQIAEYDNVVNERIKKYAATSQVQEEKDWLNKFDAALKSYRAARENVLTQNKEGKNEAAWALAKGDAGQRFIASAEALEKLVDVNVREAHDEEEAAEEAVGQTTMLQTVLLILAVIIGLSIAAYLARSISSGVGQMARAAEGIAAGDLAQEIDVRSNDEVGQMAVSFTRMIEYLREMASTADAIAEGDLTRIAQPKSDRDVLGSSFKAMTTNLRQLVYNVTESATNVAASSEQLAQAADQAGSATQQIAATIQQVAKGAQVQSVASQDADGATHELSRAIDQIARGAQEQSHAIQDTTTMVDRMAAAIARVSKSSQVIVLSAGQAEEAARSGAKAVDDTIQGMNGIRETVSNSARSVKELGEYSDQIGKIVETIDDIAEQTNLLALNAAIEAARAGEHGKGFAVVADEVRKLAERSARATKEITHIIKTVQTATLEAVTAMEKGAREVEDGSNLSAEAGRALKDILRAVQESNEQIHGIARAVGEMESLSTEVARSIESVSAVVEENTAATEQMAASANQMASSITSVAATSEENAASVEEVSAGTEEMSAQVEELVSSVESLAQMAEDLKEAVSRFKLDEGATQGETVLRRRKTDWARQAPAERSGRAAAYLRTM